MLVSCGPSYIQDGPTSDPWRWRSCCRLNTDGAGGVGSVLGSVVFRYWEMRQTIPQGPPAASPLEFNMSAYSSMPIP